ncbi:MAG: CHAT domain-containing protein [Pyrinomonadaceae bacterium]|nr:CHAT domain-containing protein [Pyrinomonadaceae bacterium]
MNLALLPQRIVESTSLELGKPVAHELVGGDEHSYQITLTEGQYASVLVEQQGIDVAIQLLGKEREIIVSFDGEYQKQGEERIEMVAGAAGTYRLIVRASSKSAPAGLYEIRVAEIHAATRNDRLLHDARKLEADSRRALIEGKYEDVRLFAERALAISESVFGAEHPFTARVIHQLAYYHFYKQEYGKAESLFQRALSISEKSLGPGHPQAIDITRALGILYFWTNERTKSEELLQRAVDISQKTLGSEHFLVARCLGDLARIIKDQKRKEATLQSALEIAEKTVGPDHELVGDVLGEFGVLYLRTDKEKAKQLFLRADATYQKTLGPDNLKFAESLHHLGRSAQGRGEHAQAEDYYLKSIAITEKTLGPDNANSATTLNNLAGLYDFRDQYEKSLETYLRVLRISERSYGPNHSLTTTSLGNIAMMYASQRNLAEAVKFQQRVDAAIELNLQLNLLIGSESEKLSYISSLGLGRRTDRTISLSVDLAPHDGAASALAALVVLQRKGRVLDAMSQSFASLRQRSTPEERALIEQYNETTSDLARLVLNGPQTRSIEDHQKQISELERQKERLEAQISRRSARFRAASQPVTLSAVQAAIPINAALVEFAIYCPFNPNSKRASEAYKEPRYVAYVLRRSGEVRWLDLGDAKAINNAIGSLRQALRDPLRRESRELARVVDEKLMQPVRTLVGDATQLLVSPDGELNLIPFEALVDERGHYLIERFSFTYLTSGRDLLSMQTAPESTHQPLLIANPFFGEPVTERAARNGTAKPDALRAKRRNVIEARDISDVYFAPLSATAQEARTIQTLFPEANLLAGEQATEARLKQAAAPRILHIATHGFFLSDELAPTDTRGTRAISANTRIENPLLRSGLALAGANLDRATGEDGILTAMEASGLNLWGTELVVLSACDTGLGEVRNGEGVYGLRRAFVLAGAETLVMSLWPVSDYSTRNLMIGYYKNLRLGMGRSAALRQVQLDLLKRNGQLHPFYWANFIQSGEWANLSGKR